MNHETCDNCLGFEDAISDLERDNENLSEELDAASDQVKKLTEALELIHERAGDVL